MRYSLCLLVCWLAFAAVASARLGETREECHQRYGQPVTNYPGEGPVAGCEVYVKDGIAISVVFVKTAKQESRAGLVIYSRTGPAAHNGNGIPAPEITPAEQTALLATVAGRWDNYDPPAALAGKPGKVVTVETKPSITQKQRDSAVEAVQKAIEAVYPYSLRVWFGRVPQDVGHNGPKVFAFRAARGLAICSSDASTPIAAWADRVILEQKHPQQPPKSNLTGF